MWCTLLSFKTPQDVSILWLGRLWYTQCPHSGYWRIPRFELIGITDWRGVDYIDIDFIRDWGTFRNDGKSDFYGCADCKRNCNFRHTIFRGKVVPIKIIVILSSFASIRLMWSEGGLFGRSLSNGQIIQIHQGSIHKGFGFKKLKHSPREKLCQVFRIKSGWDVIITIGDENDCRFFWTR